VWARVTVSLAHDATGAGDYDIAVFEDISARKRAEARLIEAERRAAVAHLERELAIARRIQTSLLPASTSVDGFEIAARMATASEVGGDYYEVQPTGDGGCWLGIGDVSGHGLDAGLVMLMLQAGVSALVSRDPDGDPATLLTTVNRMLYENIRTRLGSNDFATLCLMRFQRDGRLAFAGAHEEILSWRATNGRCERVPTPGTWVGGRQDISDATKIVRQRLEPGDVMLLYTDGIIEAPSAHGERFGSPRLLNTLEELHHLPAAEICDRLFERLHGWSAIRDDDQTALLLRFLGDATTPTLV
jgi:sigma-B regulation protein RsbU (phosphoserine phosphatase)